MKKNIEVYQNSFKDCASSCLLSIIRYYGGDYSYEELTLLLKTNNNGTNAYNLINGAKLLGFDGYAKKCTLDEIINSKIKLPLIAHTRNNNYYHFIVIYEINEKTKELTIMDPVVGINTIPFEKFNKLFLNTIIVLYPIKPLPKLDKKDGVTKVILSYLKHDKGLIITLMFLSIFMVLLSIVSNYFIKIIVNSVINNYTYRLLVYVSFVFINILFLKTLLDFIRNKLLIHISNKINIKINKETINHLFNLPYLFFKNKSTGEVLSRINDLKKFNDIVENIVANILLNIILIVVSMIVLLSINASIFIICFVSMILYFIVVIIYKEVFKKEIFNYQISNSDYNKTLIESIEGYESFKNINLLGEIKNKINNKLIINVKNDTKHKTSLINQRFIKNIIMDINYAITIFLSVIYINKNIINLGDFLVYNSLMVYFIEPLKNILDLEPSINYIKGVYNRINDILIVRNKVSRTDLKIKGDIVINNLIYSYDSVNNALYLSSLNIKCGSKILIYGASGSGKSTLFKILLKYLKEYSGEIYVNSTNLKQIDDAIISNSVTFVSQNGYLINDTFKNNIIMNRDISNEEYNNVIDICNLNNILKSKNLLDDFLIEDNGFNISGGERQKILLARSLLKKSNFIILDEALSEVGFIEEKEIINKINTYYKDKTIIYSSHKKELLNLFSNKYCLERGKNDLR